MLVRPRLLPVLAGTAAVLLCAKLGDIWFAIGADPIAVAAAETTPAEAKSEPAAPAAPASEQGRAPKPAATKTAVRDPAQLTPQELQILQSLAQRRSELDKRASEIDQREALLQAAEQRINEKIAKLQEMEKAIDASFKKQDQQDDTKLKSLVKIYETMKPKEAARIFEQLDLPVLLDVMERMKEAKTAPILADMDPGKARAVTLALAQRHPAPELKN
jgi:flagellar motility protein MotE (MotC chaperone)